MAVTGPFPLPSRVFDLDALNASLETAASEADRSGTEADRAEAAAGEAATVAAAAAADAADALIADRIAETEASAAAAAASVTAAAGHESGAQTAQGLAEAAAAAAEDAVQYDYLVADDTALAALTGMTTGQRAFVRVTEHVWSYSGSAWVDLGLGPSGGLRAAIAATDARTAAFDVAPGLLLSVMRVVVTGPDGLDYVRVDVPVDSAGPIEAFVTRSAETDEAIVVAPTNTPIILVGDSMSAAGSGIIDVLPSRFPLRSVRASAEGGERTAGIAASFGVPDLLTYALAGNVIPASGTVVATSSISHLPVSSSALVDIIAETGISVRCRVYNNAGTYELRPVTYPAAPIRVQNPARARVVSLQAGGSDPTAAQLLDPLYDGIGIFRDGRNDIGHDKAYSGPTLIDLTQRMVALMRSGKYIILGVTNGSNDVPTSLGGTHDTISEANSLTTLSNVRDLNGRRAATFPGHFYSPLANFEAEENTTDLTVGGQTFAVIDADVLADGLHENATGKGLTCDLIETAITELEY